MKRFVSVFLFVLTLVGIQAFSQPLQLRLPASVQVPHFLLPVGYNSTTVLVFAAPVKPVDRGNRDILAQRQAGTDNVLKLKAARRNFTPTNLHVFTADGRLFAFDIAYSDSIGATYDLSSFSLPDSVSPSHGAVRLSDAPVNSAQLDSLVTKAKELRTHRKGPAVRSEGMVLRLQAIGLSEPLYLLRLRISNHSSVDYPLDFLRLYIRDRQKAKRTSIQEKEIIPVYMDDTKVVPGNGAITYIVAVPAFTLAKGKQFIVEAYERNGGRQMTLLVSNRTLLRAIKI